MAAPTMQLSQRDLAEVARSAVEASKTRLTAANLDRYMAPPSETSFSLEYAYHLIGDVRGRTVLDFGCGSGENLVPLLMRGANVIGIDISPELIEIARTRVARAGMKADLRVASAYHTGLANASIDLVFCVSLVHHLDIPLAREEMRRILAPGGQIVFKEPICLSSGYSRVRSWLPSREAVSEYEHPLTNEELAALTEGFAVRNLRYFRLPFVPLARRVLRIGPRFPSRASDWCLRHIEPLQRYATVAVGRMADCPPVTRRRAGMWLQAPAHA